MTSQPGLTRTSAIMAETIDNLVAVEDALEARLDTPGITREGYISMHVPDARLQAAEAWDYAEYKIRKHGTVRKALNDVRRKLDRFRD